METMTKRELMQKLKADRKKLVKQLADDDRAPNPNYRKGRRSFREIFNDVNIKDKMV